MAVRAELSAIRSLRRSRVPSGDVTRVLTGEGSRGDVETGHFGNTSQMFSDGMQGQKPGVAHRPSRVQLVTVR